MREIPGCPGYFATEDGRIISRFRGREREIRQFDRKRLDGTPSPYLSVSATRDGRRCNRFVHDLVCLAFHGPRPSADHEVRHKDGNPKNNAESNLAWGTVEENTMDRVKHDAWTRAWAKRRATMPPPRDDVPCLDGESGHAFADLLER